MLQLANVLGALPIHILALETKWTTAEMQEVLKIFQAEARDVMTAMRVILANMYAMLVLLHGFVGLFDLFMMIAMF